MEHTGIKNKASIIHIKQYRQWRHNGIAYEFGDQTYSEPNRTMMTYTEGFIKKGKEKGLKKEVGNYTILYLLYLQFLPCLISCICVLYFRILLLQVKGFWGDIVCSPYFALGIDCDTPNKHAEGLYEIINKVCRNHVVNIVVHSLSCCAQFLNHVLYTLV